ncbi:hypothetical protein [Halomonas sp. DQ26W]|uniref:hypothetical protein n=1 Tax=Halomonas sp. DQ26W TaxID=2282311 RepID=UPI0015EFF7B5|nr:hypothetical protein [Halomonas sp. DQ26W]
MTGLVMLGLGQAWLTYRARQARAAGEGYGEHESEPPPHDYLRERAAGEGFDLAEVDPQPRRGLPSLPLALLPIVLVIALNLLFTAVIIPAMDTGYLSDPVYGANASLLPIFNTASLVGFDSVIASLVAFEAINAWVTTAGGDRPLISLALAVNLLAGMTDSASGGMSIALSTLGDTYLAMGQAAGISPDHLLDRTHRGGVSGGFVLNTRRWIFKTSACA